MENNKKYYLVNGLDILEIKIFDITCRIKNISLNSDISDKLNIYGICINCGGINKLLVWNLKNKEFNPLRIYETIDNAINNKNNLFIEKNGLLFYNRKYIVNSLPDGVCLNDNGNLSTWRMINNTPELIKLTDMDDTTQDPIINLVNDNIIINPRRGYSTKENCLKYKYDITYYQ